MVRRKIILFIDSLVAGGAQRQIILLAEELYKYGHEVVVLNYSHDEQLLERLVSAGIRREVVFKSSKLDLKFLYNLYKFFKMENPDVIISYLNTPNLWARLIGKLAKIKHIITSERNIDLDKSMFRLFLEKLLHPLSDYIVVNAFAIKDLLIFNGVPERKIMVIYNGVDTDYFSKVPDHKRQVFRKSLGVQSEVLITLPGRMTAQKNHICLLEAFIELHKNHSNIKLLFVGNEFDPSIKLQLLKLIERNDLVDLVIFFGPSEDMPLVYSSSDIVVLPSLWEGLPNVILEAMSCAVPVIATDVSDNSKIIEDKIDGYVVIPDDAIDLKEKLHECLNLDRVALSEMGANSKRHVEALCSISAFRNKYLSIIT